MPKAKFPKPRQPLPKAPKRPWGTGSIDQRGTGYLARWRDQDGNQASEMFATIEDAARHLDVAMSHGQGNRPIRQETLRDLAAHWRILADITATPDKRPAGTEEPPEVKASRLVREATATAMRACANGLEEVLRG